MCAMNPAALVCLSLCSHKMYRWIQREHRKFSNVFQLCLVAGTETYARISLSTTHICYTVLNARGLSALDNTNGMITVKIRGHEVLARLDVKGFLYTYWEDPVFGFKEIIQYLSDLFHLDIYGTAIGQRHLGIMDWVQSRQKVVDRTLIPTGAEFTAKEYQHVLSTNTSEILFIGAKPPTDFYHFDAILPHTEIFIQYGAWVRAEHLQRMDCVQIMICDANLSSKDMNIILKHWLGGMLNRLKCLMIQTRRPIFRFEIFSDLESRMVLVEEEMQFVSTFDGSRKIAANHHAIKRNDGKVASIEFQPGNRAMGLFVWPNKSS